MKQTHDTIMALDVGDKRIGYALANKNAVIASPGGVVVASSNAIDDIKKLLKDHNTTQLVIGLPRNLNGNDTNQTKQVRKFVAKLKIDVSIPIHWQDEALSSSRAKQELRDRGVEYNKGMVDSLAATYILTDFLTDNISQS